MSDKLLYAFKIIFRKFKLNYFYALNQKKIKKII